MSWTPDIELLDLILLIYRHDFYHLNDFLGLLFEFEICFKALIAEMLKFSKYN